MYSDGFRQYNATNPDAESGLSQPSTTNQDAQSGFSQPTKIRWTQMDSAKPVANNRWETVHYLFSQRVQEKMKAMDAKPVIRQKRPWRTTLHIDDEHQNLSYSAPLLLFDLPVSFHFPDDSRHRPPNAPPAPLSLLSDPSVLL